jgi:hypothetical protein
VIEQLTKLLEARVRIELTNKGFADHDKSRFINKLLLGIAIWSGLGPV